MTSERPDLDPIPYPVPTDPLPAAGDAEGEAVEVGVAPGVVGFAVVVCGAVGGALGFFLPALAHAVTGLAWAPMQGPFRLVEQLDAHVAWWVLSLVGVVVGVVLALAWADEAATVTVDRRAVVLTRGKKQTRYARAQVGEAQVDGRHLTLRDHDDVDLVRHELHGPPDRLVEALRRFDWPG